jgi:PAS domain S-box-containing protein
MCSDNTLERLKRVNTRLDEFETSYFDRKNGEVLLLLQVLTDIVVVLDTAMNVRYANPSAYEVLGFAENELVGKPFEGFVQGEKFPIETGFNTNVRTSTGEEIHAHVYIGELHDMDSHLYVAVIKRLDNDPDRE